MGIRNVRRTTVLNGLLVAVSLVAFVLLASRSSSAPGVEVESRPPPAGIDEVRVDVRGAVQDPGVYTIEAGDRVADVIERAGGATSDADLAAVNLALRLRDEDVIRVPFLDEAQQLTNLNTASQDALEALPGVGPVRASAIIAGRPYASIEGLLDAEVIPASVYEQIRMLVTAP
jgi:competence protein ComEA